MAYQQMHMDGAVRCVLNGTWVMVLVPFCALSATSCLFSTPAILVRTVMYGSGDASDILSAKLLEMRGPKSPIARLAAFSSKLAAKVGIGEVENQVSERVRRRVGSRHI
mgnify:CR=1 FL=1